MCKGGSPGRLALSSASVSRELAGAGVRSLSNKTQPGDEASLSMCPLQVGTKCLGFPGAPGSHPHAQNCHVSLGDFGSENSHYTEGPSGFFWRAPFNWLIKLNGPLKELVVFFVTLQPKALDSNSQSPWLLLQLRSRTGPGLDRFILSPRPPTPPAPPAQNSRVLCFTEPSGDCGANVLQALPFSITHLFQIKNEGPRR